MSTRALSPAAQAILWGGLLAGTGDLLFAFCYYGWELRIFQTVAGGVLGREAAFSGGVGTFALGIVLHYGIATIWAALFWLLGRALPVVLRAPIPAGLAYGTVVFYGMNSIVLPLSALHTKPWPPVWQPVPLLGHLVLVGLPIGLAAARAARRAAR